MCRVFPVYEVFIAEKAHFIDLNLENVWLSSYICRNLNRKKA